jgi:hypothetical protein
MGPKFRPTIRCLVASALMLLACGCTPPKLKTEAAEPTRRGSNAGTSGLVSQVRQKVEQVVTAAEMKDLHLFMDAASAVEGRLPNVETIRAAVSRENPKLGQLLQDGSIVLTGIRQREGIWAYEKDAPERGGWIIDQSGPRQVTAAEFRQLLGR